ncbi:J domain-containing protein [Clostridium sp. D53t1_180928_C8]|uniref:J domain-containing protein n=1 Tax=Clostridium sp. D53t1_180928_C8 TaxID=2787101 RepID=UPI0018AB4883|nr:J domain-containing protein [Clostridium sp. D53t1_180928_C8]
MLSIDEIRNIKYPYELFSDDIEDIKSKYVELMKVYHPDLNGKKKEYIEITNKINNLYKQAEKNIAKGVWEKPGFIRLKCIDGKYYTMNFRISHIFEIGRMYIGNEEILYLINDKNEKMAINAINKLNNIKYSNIEMKKEFDNYLPQIKKSFRTIGGEVGIVVKKDEDLILLRDLMTYCNGKIPINTVSWILNSLYNIACFLSFNGLTHNGITLDSYFVSIKKRYGALLGGWWYAIKEGKNILGVPKDISSLISYDMKNNKIATSKLDLEAIRLLGKTLLGDKKGILLSMDINIPNNLMVWLEENSSDNPFDEYINWNNISSRIEVKNINGVNIDKDDLYKKLGGN